MTAEEQQTRQKRGCVSPTLAVLLLLIPGAILGYFRATRDYHIVALLKIAANAASPEVLAQRQQELIEILSRRETILATVNEPSVVALRSVAAQNNPEEFLSARLRTDVLNDGSVEISLVGYTRNPEGFSAAEDLELLKTHLITLLAAVERSEGKSGLQRQDIQIIHGPKQGHRARNFD